MIFRAKLIILIFLSLAGRCFSQKYNFVNFTVEDGLIQSQAMHIVQDKNHYLWIGTEGGLCKFDGKKFVKYSSQEGIASNFINKLLCDETGKIWIATKKGVSVFNGKSFAQVVYKNASVGHCNFLFEKDGAVYTIHNLHLGIMRNLSYENAIISDTSEKITTLYKTPAGDLLAYVYGKGIFALNKKTWTRLSSAEGEFKNLGVRNIFITAAHDTLLATVRGILVQRNGRYDSYKFADNSTAELNVFCFEQFNNSIWFGTDKGAYKISNGTLAHFNSKNGLTDNNVYSIFKDQESNLWFASDADGIFKFKENNFSFYDKSFGLVNPTIMGVAQTTDGNIFAADYSGNLYKLNEQNVIEPLKLDNPEINQSKINTIYADSENNLYVGSLGKKIYRYNYKTGLKVIGNDIDYKLRGSNCFLKDSRGNLLVGNAQGLFLIDKDDRVKKIETMPGVFNAIVEAGNNTLLVANTSGVLLLDKDYKATYPKIKGTENNEILCLKYKDGIAWLGSTEHGVFRWDTKTNNVRQYNVSGGLPSDFIYSMIVRNNNDVWLGTGFGICNLILDNWGEIIKVKNFSRSDGLIGMECNHTSELLAADSTLWFGTTKGLAHFKPSSIRNENVAPYVILKSVKLFSADIADSSLCNGFTEWDNIPKDLELSSSQNHLTFELTGIYFTNPDDVLFKYKLEGIDKDYTTSKNPLINYPALPAGKYTLVVYAVTKGGVQSANAVQYDFIIKKAYYQEAWFLLLVFFLLAGISGLIIFLYLKKKRDEKIFREKVREEEFTKLRQRTAEDFHDEMGNKLTRISVLTDILKSKVSPAEKEALNIVSQIKENTTALYNGSRDIIWSLNSRNDNFFEITEHVKNLGQEIFSETSTDFEFNHNLRPADNIKLKLDYSRNLIMIFKEVYNNILKHSHAHAVKAKIELVDNHEAIILISDNGKGFDSGIEHKGNGLKNIQNRIKRINGTFSINSSVNNGTEIVISLKDIFHI